MKLADYPSPSVTADCVVFGITFASDGPALRVLLIERGEAPFEGALALPGGFVRMAETIDDAARRELREETGLDDVFLEQLYTFGALDRDPRGRVVSVAYYALVNLADHRVRSGTDARDARWVAVQDARDLAFDHDRILAVALERLRGKVRYQPIGFEMLPERFKLSQLQALYEAILGRALDKRNFRKRILAMGLLAQAGEERGVPHRAARLYRFEHRRYESLRRRGFDFEI
jgi:ADP-ribose pyrophosphatase YjhB (NUDIX family)